MIKQFKVQLNLIQSAININKLLTTTGAISSGFNSARTSGGKMSSVNLLAAVGVIQLQ